MPAGHPNLLAGPWSASVDRSRSACRAPRTAASSVAAPVRSPPIDRRVVAPVTAIVTRAAVPSAGQKLSVAVPGDHDRVGVRVRVVEPVDPRTVLAARRFGVGPRHRSADAGTCPGQVVRPADRAWRIGTCLGRSSSRLDNAVPDTDAPPGRQRPEGSVASTAGRRSGRRDDRRSSVGIRIADDQPALRRR